MVQRINSYIAILIITIAGVLATLVIVHVANKTTFGYYKGTNLSAQINDTQ
ncbi:hypothetical protein MNBD_CPR01-84 [hydrothermal vent metagenome]|uniref:Uncharacterized protein n=1 Tax=hydrothermal vent metagenome TaxID=652676 RepID=A0A3B0UW57_9ZZZZ